MEKEKNTNEPSLLIVLVVIAFLGLGFLVISNKDLMNLSELMGFLDVNEQKLLTLGGVSFVNIILYSFFGSLFFGIRKQGTRLKILTGEIKEIRKKKFHISMIFIFLFLFSYLLTDLSKYPVFRTYNISFIELCKYLTFIFRFNLALSFSIVLLPLAMLLKKLFKKVKESELPDFPEAKNSIVLGSVNEENSKFNDKSGKGWVKIPLSGLYGNLLAFGSIGSGKTSGIIKPAIDQILSSFDKFPTILALDTKGNFSSFLLKLLKEKKVSKKKIYHIHLEGNVTLNPVYKEKILKDSGFVEVADYVRVASANFQGSSGDSPFWDTKATALIKYCIVYCAAIYRYFTLSNVYETILSAIDSEKVATLGTDLQNVLTESKDFDEEEKFNINAALRFFTKEYNALDDKVKTGVMATATLLLDIFNEYKAHRLFCPSEEELTIKNLEKVVNGGNVIILDINKEGLSRPASIFIKTLYQRIILDRLKTTQNKKRKKKKKESVPAVLIGDEMQDWVTASNNGLSDSTFLSKGREAKSIVIAATQSMSTLKDALKAEVTTDVIKQCFKTIISGQTSDEKTINLFKIVGGKVEEQRESHSVSETTQNAVRNPMTRNLESGRGNVSESVSKSTYKEDFIQGDDLFKLKKFEMIGYVFNGVETTFKKIFLKPTFLEDKKECHSHLLSRLSETVACFCLFVAMWSNEAMTASLFPTICSVVKTAQYSSCLDFQTKGCWCKSPWPLPPRPCVRVSYYLPNTFMEVFPNAGESYFKALPAAAAQLVATVKEKAIPYGAESDHDAYSFHSHVLAMPLSWLFSFLPCGGQRTDKMCFDGMSEHLGMNWKTGAADKLQPRFLAWSLAPKACIIKGAAMSVSGGGEATFGGEGGCGYPMDWLPQYPPSNHSACNGWGLFYPRHGVYNGVNQTTGAMMIASRMKSISSEVLRNTPSSPDEKWQMIYPKSSQCFREGQNMSILELPKGVNEIGRITSGKLTGHLFGTYKKVSCCVDWAFLPYIKATLEMIKGVCRGL